jgi:hypothetical protein
LALMQIENLVSFQYNEMAKNIMGTHAHSAWSVSLCEIYKSYNNNNNNNDFISVRGGSSPEISIYKDIISI